MRFFKPAHSIFKVLLIGIVVAFLGTALLTDVLRVKQSLASNLDLPEPLQLLKTSSDYSLPVLRGVRLDQDNPLALEFILDIAHLKNKSKRQLKKESDKLIKYFLAALTIPKKDLWVNLSPYEQDRIAPDVLAQTDMGRQMLAQDYILKQLSSSLTHPETATGQMYWLDNIQEAMGKIWIKPDKSVVYENEDTAYIKEATLKVVAEDSASYSSLIPEITEDVNQGKNFTQLRQVYHSLILGLWFKEKLKHTFYQAYINQNKTAGIDVEDKDIKEKIWSLYCESFEKGVYSFVRSDAGQKRQYFSGGLSWQGITLDRRPISQISQEELLSSSLGDIRIVSVDLKGFDGENEITSSGVTNQEKMQRILDSGRGLIRIDDTNVLDAYLFDKAKQDSVKYVRVTLQTQQDLDRLAKLIKVEDGSFGSIDGPLYDVIRNGGILLLDFANSDPKLIGGFHSLFDPDPFYKDIKGISPDLQVVAAMKNEKMGAFDAAGFLDLDTTARSRFFLTDRVDGLGYTDPLSKISVFNEEEHKASIEIELDSAFDFERRLLGGPEFDQKGNIISKQGLLHQAIEENNKRVAQGKDTLPILIKGDCWNNQKFLIFMRQLMLRGEYFYNSELIEIPDNFTVVRSSLDYSQGIENKEFVAGQTETDQDVYVINAKTQDVLFGRRYITEDGTRKNAQLPGVLENEKVSLRITEKLDAWVWHRIMHSANHVEIEIASGVFVPKIYRGLTLSEDKKEEKSSLFVETNDNSLTRAVLTDQYGIDNVLFYPITSSTEKSHLFETIEVESTKDGYQFDFVKKQLLEELENGKTIVLENIDSNKELMLELSTLLCSRPYLMVNGIRRELNEFSGRIVMTVDQLDQEVNQASIKQNLLKYFPESYSEELFDVLIDLKDSFDDFSVDFSRAALFFEHLSKTKNILKAFEDVFISNFYRSKESQAHMRSVARIAFGVKNGISSTDRINGTKLFEVLNTLTAESGHEEIYWQLVDALGFEQMKSMVTPGNSFDLRDIEKLKNVIGRALVRYAKTEDNQYDVIMYKAQFGVDDDISQAAEIDMNLPGSYEHDEDRRAHVREALDMFRAVFLKGSPGTGKSHIAFEMAKELGFGTEDIVGPVTTGNEMSEAEIVGSVVRSKEGNSEFEPEAIAEWIPEMSFEEAQVRRGRLLIVDEANLPEEEVWNFLRGYFARDKKQRYVWVNGKRRYFSENDRLIFTGNQESLEGRVYSQLVQTNMMTINFEDYDRGFYQQRLNEYLSSKKHRRDDLMPLMLDVHQVFTKINPEKVFSLRDVQEFARRVNKFVDKDWTVEQVLYHAWKQYYAQYDPEERNALAEIFKQKYDVDVVQMHQQEIDKYIEDNFSFFKDRSKDNRVILTRSSAEMAIAAEDFISLIEDSSLSQIQGKRAEFFQGVSGRGKDLLLNAVFDKKREEDKREGLPERKVIRVNVSPDTEEFVEAVRKAQREGAILVAMEMNHLPSAFIEGKLNDVLTGVAKPGFALFATMNTADFGATENFSTAMYNRSIFHRIDDYPQGEFQTIFTEENQGLSSEDITHVVNTHCWVRQNVEHLNKQPTTRDIRNVIKIVAEEGLNIDEAIDRVYGDYYLNGLLKNIEKPEKEELVDFQEEERVDAGKSVGLVARAIRQELNVQLSDVPGYEEFYSGRLDKLRKHMENFYLSRIYSQRFPYSPDNKVLEKEAKFVEAVINKDRKYFSKQKATDVFLFTVSALLREEFKEEHLATLSVLSQDAFGMDLADRAYRSFHAVNRPLKSIPFPDNAQKNLKNRIILFEQMLEIKDIFLEIKDVDAGVDTEKTRKLEQDFEESLEKFEERSKPESEKDKSKSLVGRFFSGLSFTNLNKVLKKIHSFLGIFGGKVVRFLKLTFKGKEYVEIEEQAKAIKITAISDSNVWAAGKIKEFYGRVFGNVLVRTGIEWIATGLGWVLSRKISMMVIVPLILLFMPLLKAVKKAQLKARIVAPGNFGFNVNTGKGLFSHFVSFFLEHFDLPMDFTLLDSMFDDIDKDVDQEDKEEDEEKAFSRSDVSEYLMTKQYSTFNPISGKRVLQNNNFIEYALPLDQQAEGVVEQSFVEINDNTTKLLLHPGYKIVRVETEKDAGDISILHDPKNAKWAMKYEKFPGIIKIHVVKDDEIDISVPVMVDSMGLPIEREHALALIKDSIPAKVWDYLQAHQGKDTDEKIDAKDDILSKFYYSSNPLLRRQANKHKNFLKFAFENMGLVCDGFTLLDATLSYVLELPVLVQGGYASHNGNFIFGDGHAWISDEGGIREPTALSAETSPLEDKNGVTGKLWRKELALMKARALERLEDLDNFLVAEEEETVLSIVEKNAELAAEAEEEEQEEQEDELKSVDPVKREDEFREITEKNIVLMEETVEDMLMVTNQLNFQARRWSVNGTMDFHRFFTNPVLCCYKADSSEEQYIPEIVLYEKVEESDWNPIIEETLLFLLARGFSFRVEKDRVVSPTGDPTRELALIKKILAEKSESEVVAENQINQIPMSLNDIQKRFEHVYLYGAVKKEIEEAASQAELESRGEEPFFSEEALDELEEDEFVLNEAERDYEIEIINEFIDYRREHKRGAEPVEKYSVKVLDSGRLRLNLSGISLDDLKGLPYNLKYVQELVLHGAVGADASELKRFSNVQRLYLREFGCKDISALFELKNLVYCYNLYANAPEEEWQRLRVYMDSNVKRINEEQRQLQQEYASESRKVIEYNAVEIDNIFYEARTYQDGTTEVYTWNKYFKKYYPEREQRIAITKDCFDELQILVNYIYELRYLGVLASDVTNVIQIENGSLSVGLNMVKKEELENFPEGLKYLRKMYITGAELVGVANLPAIDSLEELTFSSWDFKKVPDLRKFKNIKKLDISGCKHLKSLPGIFELKNLVEVIFRDSGIADKKRLARRIVELTETNKARIETEKRIEGLTETQDDLKAEVKGLGKWLERLFAQGLISEDKFIDKDTIQVFGDRYIVVNLSGTDITTLEDMPAGLEYLQSLILSDCHELTDISALAGMKNIKALRFDDCYSLKDVSVIEGLVNLETLILKNCIGLTIEAVKPLLNLAFNNQSKLFACEVEGTKILVKDDNIIKEILHKRNEQKQQQKEVPDEQEQSQTEERDLATQIIYNFTGIGEYIFNEYKDGTSDVTQLAPHAEDGYVGPWDIREDLTPECLKEMSEINNYLKVLLDNGIISPEARAEAMKEVKGQIHLSLKDLNGLRSIDGFPLNLKHLVSLSIEDSGLVDARFLTSMVSLEQLSFKGCQELKHSPNFLNFPSLTNLNINGCKKLGKLKEALRLEKLIDYDVEGSGVAGNIEFMSIFESVVQANKRSLGRASLTEEEREEVEGTVEAMLDEKDEAIPDDFNQVEFDAEVQEVEDYLDLLTKNVLLPVDKRRIALKAENGKLEITIEVDDSFSAEISALVEFPKKLKYLHKLNLLNLSNLEMLDVSLYPNLKELNVKGCSKLRVLTGVFHLDNLLKIEGLEDLDLGLNGTSRLLMEEHVAANNKRKKQKQLNKIDQESSLLFKMMLNNYFVDMLSVLEKVETMCKEEGIEEEFVELIAMIDEQRKARQSSSAVGGIDFEELLVESSASSSAITYNAPFDMSRFRGFIFSITSIKSINSRQFSEFVQH